MIGRRLWTPHRPTSANWKNRRRWKRPCTATRWIGWSSAQTMPPAAPATTASTPKVVPMRRHGKARQRDGVHQINASVEQASLVTQSTAASSEESAAASEELSSQAALMLGTIRQFELAAKAFSIPDLVQVVTGGGLGPHDIATGPLLIRPLARDVVLDWRLHYGARVLPHSICRDERLREALACKQPVTRYRPDADASQAARSIARWCLSA